METVPQIYGADGAPNAQCFGQLGLLELHRLNDRLELGAIGV